MLTQLKSDFKEDVRVVYRHFPLLTIHDKAGLAVQATEAAGLQGKFWEMHDLLYLRQSEWASLTEGEFTDWAVDRASEIGLDPQEFSETYLQPDIVEIVQIEYAAGLEIGIPGTPFLIINGRIYNGPTDYVNLSTIVKLFALQERQFSECPPIVIDPAKNYLATIETENGDIVIDLLAGSAPLAVNNFVFLAMNQWFEGVTFHRVLEGYIAQAGDPTGTGFGGPGYAFVNETSDLLFDEEGLLAMANAGADTNGSQFFITLGPAPQLNGSYTIFGRVIEGMDIAQNITLRNPEAGPNQPPGDTILRISIEEQD